MLNRKSVYALHALQHLAQHPDERFSTARLDILRVVEGPIALLPCASHRFYEPCAECPNPQACALQDALVQVRNETVHALKSISLADMVARASELTLAQRNILRPTPYLRTP